tara:strand:- start:203 stop:640 length:438 start_codon:yes stop_codon:yes gene_type:complete
MTLNTSRIEQQPASLSVATCREYAGLSWNGFAAILLHQKLRQLIDLSGWEQWHLRTHVRSYLSLSLKNPGQPVSSQLTSHLSKRRRQASFVSEIHVPKGFEPRSSIAANPTELPAGTLSFMTRKTVKFQQRVLQAASRVGGIRCI